MAFLVANGAAVDVLSSDRGRGELSDRRCSQRAASATPPVLRSDSTALGSSLRPRGVRPAAAGSKGLRGNEERHRLGASADVPFLTYLLIFFQLQHEIALDFSSQVPVFKVPLKFKSRDFGACVS